jgi:hypothetical protein
LPKVNVAGWLKTEVLNPIVDGRIGDRGIHALPWEAPKRKR